MTNTRNCSVIIQQSLAVLSWNDEIFLMHRTHQQEVQATHTLKRNRYQTKETGNLDYMSPLLGSHDR